MALRDRLDARICETIGDFDAARLWDIDAATSLTAWLRSFGAMTSPAAGRLSVLARRLHRLPVTAVAYAEGSLSGGQVEAIVAQLDATVELFAQGEAELVPYLAPLRVAGVSRAMAAWKAQAQAEPAEPADPERSLHLSPTLDDRHVLNGSLDAAGDGLDGSARVANLAVPQTTAP